VTIGKPLDLVFDSESKSAVSCHDLAGSKIYNSLMVFITSVAGIGGRSRVSSKILHVSANHERCNALDDLASLLP
jgi:hypothetical protein